MTTIAIKCSFVGLLATLSSAIAADIVGTPAMVPNVPHGAISADVSRTITGLAAVIDGRTLWFPQMALKVRLAGIDSCEVPQWSYDPTQHGDSRIPKPVPCGPLAKAWLKRMVGSVSVTCDLSSAGGIVMGRCRATSNDLAIEMLRAGWARVQGRSLAPQAYLDSQHHAMAARYGMWASYVLDMDEWRAKAVDQTLGREPIADFNLLAEREHEISPPFRDARKRPIRRDR